MSLKLLLLVYPIGLNLRGFILVNRAFGVWKWNMWLGRYRAGGWVWCIYRDDIKIGKKLTSKYNGVIDYLKDFDERFDSNHIIRWANLAVLALCPMVVISQWGPPLPILNELASFSRSSSIFLSLLHRWTEVWPPGRVAVAKRSLSVDWWSRCKCNTPPM